VDDRRIEGFKRFFGVRRIRCSGARGRVWKSGAERRKDPFSGRHVDLFGHGISTDVFDSVSRISECPVDT